MAEFLETVPPDAAKHVSDLGRAQALRGLRPDESYSLNQPELQLHCSSELCGGTRIFTAPGSEKYLPQDEPSFHFLQYVCRNCRRSTKTFALYARGQAGGSGLAMKLGEIPTFGPPVPAKVISLVGPDRDDFLRGRRSENQGLGIGAFGYYRRVVERQKARIIREIGSVAAMLGSPREVLERFERAAAESQFSRAIDEIKDAIPPAVLIQGHNPLALLHRSLSEGLHSRSDEECLELAAEIRLVLTELAERISQALKDDAELKAAVSRLLNRPVSKTGSDAR
jgi:hypothetical protein